MAASRSPHRNTRAAALPRDETLFLLSQAITRRTIYAARVLARRPGLRYSPRCSRADVPVAVALSFHAAHRQSNQAGNYAHSSPQLVHPFGLEPPEEIH